MQDMWKDYAADFNAMSDEQIDREAREAQERVDRETAWLEAVASWKAAGKPRAEPAR